MTQDQLRDPRAEAIADAVLRLVARDGIEAVSMRKVAAEAGSSLGAVQRTYGDKQTLLGAALVRSIERADRRIEARVANFDAEPGPVAVLRAAALEVLPLGDETRSAERVWLAFIAHAAVAPGFGRPVAERYERSRAAIAGILAAFQATGDVVARVDPAVEATAFVAVVDGLAAQLLAGLVDETCALAAVDAHIAHLVP